MFLIYNEYKKVTELRNRFIDKSGNIGIIIVTLIISIGLSGVGIYLWVDKTFENNNKAIVQKDEKTIILQDSYQKQIDSILNTSISIQPQYFTLKDNLSYWKSRVPANLEERDYLRKQVERAEKEFNEYLKTWEDEKQTKLKTLRGVVLKRSESISNDFNINVSFNRKSFYITLIFLFMVIVTEFIILGLAQEYAIIFNYNNNLYDSKVVGEYYKMMKLVISILLQSDIIKYNMVQHSKYANKHFLDDYYLLKNLNIAEVKGMTIEKANEILKNYYNNLLKIK